MTKHLRVLLVIVFMGFLWSSTTLAMLIDFDDYPTGPLSFAPADRYQTLGVIFNRDIPVYSVAVLEPQWWVNKFENGGGSLPNVMGLSRSLDPRLSIDMQFVIPGTYIPATTDYVSVLLADSEVGSTIGLVEAFDINGNLLASLSPTTPQSSTRSIQFNMLGISMIRFTDVDDGVEIDNINFNTPNTQPSPVPEPSTLLLLGSGFLGVVGLRKRFKN